MAGVGAVRRVRLSEQPGWPRPAPVLERVSTARTVPPLLDRSWTVGHGRIRAPRRATYEDLLAVPEGRVAEIIHGGPRDAAAARRAARAATRLSTKLGGLFDLGA